MTTAPATARPARWLERLEQDAARSAVIQSLASAQSADAISFAGGLPAPELFPTEALERAFARAVREQGVEALQYGYSDGVLGLRQFICQHLAERGIEAAPDQVLVTTGSTQAIELIGRTLLDPGDAVVLEAPTFMGAINCWASREPRLLPVPLDEHGMVLETLEDVLSAAEVRPKFLYVLPTFQNPSGVSLSLERRRRLLEMAERHDLLLVEDDPYGELWFDEGAPPLPPLRALPGGAERVVYLGSFSKIVAPGLRVGFIVAQPDLAKRLVRAKSGADFHTPTLIQYGLLSLLRVEQSFDLAAHVQRLRHAYRERRDAMLDALEAHLPSDAHWTRPSGGFFIWLELPPGADALRLLPIAAEEGVRVLPGAIFYPAEGGERALRLAYSQASPERIAEGVRRLGRAVARLGRP